MIRPSRLVGSAWLVYAMAWLFPVHRYGVRFPHGLPGWEAFRVACSGFWPVEGLERLSWYGAVLASSSALTNLVMLASIPILLRCSDRKRTVLAWVAAGAGVINAQWWVLDSARADLRIGYYLWWLSFIVLAAGVFRMRRGEQRDANGFHIPGERP